MLRFFVCLAIEMVEITNWGAGMPQNPFGWRWLLIEDFCIPPLTGLLPFFVFNCYNPFRLLAIEVIISSDRIQIFIMHPFVFSNSSNLIITITVYFLAFNVIHTSIRNNLTMRKNGNIQYFVNFLMETKTKEAYDVGFNKPFQFTMVPLKALSDLEEGMI